MRIFIALVFILAVAPAMVFAQSSDPDRPVMSFPEDGVWRQSFDTTYGSAGEVNRDLRAAIYVYSMLEDQGVSTDRVKVAVVIHGSATFDFLQDEQYREHYGDIANPNEALVSEFLAYGGELWMSGFGLDFREIEASELLSGVGIAPSGLIAHAELNRQGFSLNTFDGNPEKGADEKPVFTPLEGSFPLSSAVKVGNILHLSGDLGIAKDGRGLVEGGIEPETRRMMERIADTLAAHDLDYADVFKCTVFLVDMNEWQQFNSVYKSFFEPGRYPARSAVGVSALAANARVEMECLAWAGERSR